ncbi:hypothetical protein HELRODRAFT_111186 [Helobdella robusta]|uniref:SH3 domain-containing protein n=1 Tax=Helobdella robusta TaxID=6412 RepID=T1EF93_HELRO|nr:hypothetical protein HELRODRAFT_111186 [Helobdella robusta]ESO05184.1 hypothetical protein HELRODRAFT_111186 [Helobdella robusta]
MYAPIEINQVTDPDRGNDNGMTALHVAVCGLHVDVVKFLLQYGCNVNAVNNDNWTPLHYAALNSRKDLVEMLVEHGSCVYALTSDHQTPHDKCQPNEECAKVLKDYEHQLGHVNNGLVYCMVGYQAEQDEELTVHAGEMLRILRRGDEMEKEGWWWARRVTEHGWGDEGGVSEEHSHKSTTTATSIIDIDDVADVDHVEDFDDCSGSVATEQAGSATMGRHVEGSVARSIIAVYKMAPKKWI